MIAKSNAHSQGGHSPQLTRRGFLRAAGGVAAATAAFGLPAVLSGCGREKSNDFEVLTVANNAVLTLDAFAEIEDAAGLYEIKSVGALAQGTMLFGTGSALAAALCTGTTSSPLSTCGIVKLADCSMTTVLDRAVGHADGYSIFATSASDTMLAWVESNYLTADWAVYCASITDGPVIGAPVKLDAGDVNYDTPELVTIGQTVCWIVQPSENGNASAQDSYLKGASGGSSSSVLLTSHGRFNGGLSASGQTLTAMPRADSSSGVYYQLTAIQTGTGSTIASQVLPRSFRPSNAIYMNGAFAFTIPAGYDYGGGIANVGTYYPISGGQWLRLAKQSLTPPGLCNGWMFAKSGSRTVFVDPAKQRYFVVGAPDGCEDYGDYSVGTGEVACLYNYATVTKTVRGAEKTGVVLRSILPTAAV